MTDVDTTMLPEGDTWATDEEENGGFTGDIRVNFSSEEAESKSFDDLPPGKYLVAVTDGKVRFCGPASKNPGKPFYNLEYTVQDGPHTGRKLFDNVMLFEGALYSLSGLMKALGVDISAGGFVVPKVSDLLGQKFIARVKIQPARTVGDKTYDARPEVKGYFPVSTGSGPAKDELAP